MTSRHSGVAGNQEPNNQNYTIPFFIHRQTAKTIQSTIENLSVSKISTGYEHCLAITSAGSQLLSWGWNEQGNCGNGNTINCSLPVKVRLKENLKVLDCFAGSGHSFALCLHEK